MTVQAQFMPRNYDVFAGLDVDKKSMAVIFTDHVDQIFSCKLELYVHKRKQLTPKLTGRETPANSFQVLDDTRASSAPVEWFVRRPTFAQLY